MNSIIGASRSLAPAPGPGVGRGASGIEVSTFLQSATVSGFFLPAAPPGAALVPPPELFSPEALLGAALAAPPGGGWAGGLEEQATASIRTQGAIRQEARARMRQDPTVLAPRPAACRRRGPGHGRSLLWQ